MNFRALPSAVLALRGQCARSCLFCPLGTIADVIDGSGSCVCTTHITYSSPVKGRKEDLLIPGSQQG